MGRFNVERLEPRLMACEDDTSGEISEPKITTIPLPFNPAVEIVVLQCDVSETEGDECYAIKWCIDDPSQSESICISGDGPYSVVFIRPVSTCHIALVDLEVYSGFEEYWYTCDASGHFIIRD